MRPEKSHLWSLCQCPALQSSQAIPVSQKRWWCQPDMLACLSLSCMSSGYRNRERSLDMAGADLWAVPEAICNKSRAGVSSHPWGRHQFFSASHDPKDASECTSIGREGAALSAVRPAPERGPSRGQEHSPKQSAYSFRQGAAETVKETRESQQPVS